MHRNVTIAALVAVAPVILAEELRASDVPSACAVICQPIVSLTNTCDIDPNEKDNDKDKRQLLSTRKADESDEVIEAECICKNKSFNVQTVMALCASCITQNGHKTKDVDKIMSQCSFSSLSYSPSSTGIVSGIQVQATKPATANNLAQTSSTAAAPAASKTGGAGRMANPVITLTGLVIAVIAAGFQ